MASIEEMVFTIQQGNVQLYTTLRQQFRPLVYTWLKRIGHLHTNETEDYLSQANLMMWECVTTYDASRGVAFASYYKIKLYHWYGSYMKKKRPYVIPLGTSDSYLSYMGTTQTDESFHDLWTKERLQLVKQLVSTMRQEEQQLFDALLKGHSCEAIAHDMKLTKKTVQNKKYALLKRIRTAMKANYPFL